MESSMNHDGFVFYTADIRNKKQRGGDFEENEVGTVIHLAARAGARHSIGEPLLYADVNIDGTVNLLELCKEREIKNFVFGSGSSVCGINEKIPFSETDTVDRSISPYAASKKACELFCYTYHHLYGIRVACLRFFTVYGPRPRPKMAIHKFTRLIDLCTGIEMYGDGASRRDYTYLSDIVDGIIVTLNKKFDYVVINPGNPSVVELRYLIRLVGANLGKKSRIKHFPDHPCDVPVTYSDISKAKGLLVYNPRVSIEDGIGRFVKWYGEQT